MADELKGLLDGAAETLTSWLPDGLRSVLDDGANLMTSWFETNQLTGLAGVIVITGLYISGLTMTGIILGSFLQKSRC